MSLNKKIKINNNNNSKQRRKKKKKKLKKGLAKDNNLRKCPK